jgi:hypothetical protein
MLRHSDSSRPYRLAHFFPPEQSLQRREFVLKTARSQNESALLSKVQMNFIRKSALLFI